MPKVKINDIKGIVTNFDGNDLSLEALSESRNFQFENNWAEIETPNVILDTTTLDLPNAYEYEDGYTTILSSDTISESDTSFQKEIIFLSAKKVSEEIIYRKFYVKIDNVWNDIQDLAPWITDIMLQTKIEGNVFFQGEEGRLKIYLPHAAFWLGYIDRNIYIPDKIDYTYATGSGNIVYFDKLIDEFNFDDDNARIVNVDSETAVPTLMDNYRIGAVVTTSETDTADDITGIPCTWHYEETINREEDYYGGNYSLYRLINDETGEPIPYPGFNGFLEDDTNLELGNVWWFKHWSSDYEWYLAGMKVFDFYVKPTDGNDATWFNENSDFGGNSIDRSWLTDPFDSQWEYIGGALGDDDGLSLTQDRYEIITTMTLDDRSEIIVDFLVKEDVTINNYTIIVNRAIPETINKRVTRISHYLRFGKVGDFEQFADTILTDKKAIIKDVYGSAATQNGIFLSSRLGITVDPYKQDYDVVQGIKSRTLEAGYAIASSYDNPAYIQYNAIGGGKIMTDIFYYEAEIDLDDALRTTALAGSNGKVFVISDTDTKVLNIEGSTGQPVFMMVDTLEYGVKNTKDVVEAQGSVIINTNQGIYETNGYDKQWVSESINDICIENYSTSRIFYNKYNHELYYFPDISLGSFYLFSFMRKKWEGREIKDLVNIKALLQSVSGKVSFLADYAFLDTWTEKEDTYHVRQSNLSGAGTIADPILIANKSDFETIPNDLTKAYKLTSSIDMENTWPVFVTDFSTKFTGQIDGDGFTVKNLKRLDVLAAPETYSGLIGHAAPGLAGGCTMCNITFKDCSQVLTGINGANTNYNGLLVGKISSSTGDYGFNNVRLMNCHNSRQFSNTGNSVQCGLLAGASGEANQYMFSDSDCSLTNIQTTSSNLQTGGLIGSTSDVTKSMSLTQINATRNTSAPIQAITGGISQGSTQADVCFRGTISTLGDASTMGNHPGFTSRGYAAPTSFSFGATFTGWSWSSAAASSTATICYVQDNFGWVTTNESNVQSKTEALMKTQATYIGWDFTTVWGIDTTGIINDGYPYIQYLYSYPWKDPDDIYDITTEYVEYSEETVAQGFFIPSTTQEDFEATIESQLTNINSPDIEKRLNYIDVNFIGDGSFYIYDEAGTLMQSYSITATERNTERLFLKLENSQPIEKFRYKLTTTDENFKFYSMHIDFFTEEKDGGYGAIPENQEGA